MKKKHLVAGVVTIAALGGGTAGAVAATSDQKATETAVLADAAKRLGGTTGDLRSALSNAEDAQLAAAVKAGKLTQAQADEIKQHRAQEGTVLGVGGGHRGGGGPGGHHGGGRFLLADAARAIGISEDKLMTQLRDGKTLTAVAKANGKTLSEVRSAVKAAATKRLDADLKAGRITQAQHDEEVSELDDEIARLGDLRGGPGDHGRPKATPTP
jgi:Sec-independent protein translocase protein TatA